MDDADLVRQVLQGNMGAYAELVRRYTAQIAALCRAHFVRREDVEDLVQETLLRGLDRLVELRQPESFGYWLYSIARHLCQDWHRDRPQRYLPLSLVPAQEPAVEDDRVADLRKCIRHLTEQEREVVELYYAGGRLTYQEIADRLGVSFAQVNKLLTRARKRLRACLECGNGGNAITSQPA